MADTVKSVSVKLSTTGYDDARLKIEKLSVAADELGKKNPEIKPQIDSAKVLLEARLLRDGIKKELSGSVMAGSSGISGAGASAASLSSFLTPMTALIAAGVALSPVLITIGTGLAGFGAAAYAAVAPVLKAAQATGGLAANMGKLTGPQQEVAKGFLGLEADFGKFSKSLQPQVFSALNNGLGVARTLLKETAPVAKATGTALDQVIASIGKGLQSAEWKQFFAWMAANAGPDVLLVSQAIGTLTNDLPPLLMALQPVATSVLGLTVDLGKLVGAVEKVDTVAAHLNGTANNSSGIWHAVANAAKQAFGQLVPGAAAAGKLRDALDKTAPKAAKAGASVKTLGSAAETSAQQVTDLYNALHKLLDPLTQNIADAVTFKNDQVALKDALKKSHDQLGLHTAAQRASSSAAAQAAQDALTLSQNIYTQSGNAKKAIGPLEALAGELQNSGAKGAYAKQEIRLLEAAIAALKSKTIDITTVITQQTVKKGGPIPLRASGGPASGLTWVGEMGPELLSVPPGSHVYSNQQSQQMLSGRSGGATYNINVSVAPGSEREAGRHIVEAIRKYEAGSGSGWRK